MYISFYSSLHLITVYFTTFCPYICTLCTYICFLYIITVFLLYIYWMCCLMDLPVMVAHGDYG